jgi:hypothetical protein
MAPCPVVLLTGFLGAGKTTLLNALLRDPLFADSAVLINEFGEMAIDHDLVAEFGENLVTTTTGCLCCEASNDIRDSLFDLWTRRRDGRIGHSPAPSVASSPRHRPASSSPAPAEPRPARRFQWFARPCALSSSVRRGQFLVAPRGQFLVAPRGQFSMARDTGRRRQMAPNYQAKSSA